MPYRYLQPLAEQLAAFGQPVAILDLETTGGHLERDRITEIAFLRFENGAVSAVEQLVNPQIPISRFVAELTGISDDTVAGAPTLSQCLPQILPQLRGNLLIAHNSRFDYTMLQQECRRHGFAFGAPALCSVQLSRKLYPQQRKHSLDSIIERHQINVRGRHRALADVEALAQYLQAALAEHGAERWQNTAESLLNPQRLPAGISTALRDDLSAFGDGYGVSVWYGHDGAVGAVHSHRQAFRETVRLLHRQPDAVARLQFLPAAGSLHSHALRIALLAEHRLPPPEENTGCHSIEWFAGAPAGSLKARVRPLLSGWREHAPTGVFKHPKAAKRSLQQWAQDSGLCPTLLGILPHTLPAGAPCPAALAGGCSPACARQDFDLHERSARRALPALPRGIWPAAGRLRIRETDPVSGRSAVMVCDSGALLTDNGRWYTDAALLAAFQEAFKQRGPHLEIESDNDQAA